METLTNNSAPTADIIIIEPAESALAILDKREADLIVLRDESRDLKISGPEDKAGYKIVRDQRLKLKNARTSIANDAKDLREGAVKFQKTVIAREKELIAIISTAEENLIQEEDAYNQAVEKICIEKERKENERIQLRITQLAKFNHAIDLYDAKIMPEENFQALLGEAEAAFNKEQERIAQEKAAAEQERIAEQERLRVEREEMARLREDQEKREIALRAEQERIQKEQAEREATIKAEQDRKDAELKAEREKLEAEKREMELEKAKALAAEQARIDVENKIKREAAEKAEREILAEIERKRQEDLKPDKEKIKSYFDSIAIIQLPALADKNSHALMDTFCTHMNQLLTRFRTEVENLK
jgi:hypothetical protein